MESELKKFEARFGDRLIKALYGNEIKEWLTGLDIAPKTRIKIFGYIRNAYGIAVRKGLLDTHPFEKIDNFLRNKKSEAPPFPLTPEEAQRLLRCRRAFGIALYCGRDVCRIADLGTGLLRVEAFFLDEAEPSSTSRRRSRRPANFADPGTTGAPRLPVSLCEEARAHYPFDVQRQHSLSERLGTVGEGGRVVALD